MLRAATSVCTLLLILSLTIAGARADSYGGTFTMTPGDKPGQVHLQLRYRRVDANGDEEWDESHDVPRPAIRDNGFTIAEDEGEFRAQGSFNGDEGGGTWTFVPNPQFARELQRRGLSAPTDKQQFQLAISHFRLATLDTLLASGFAKPSTGDLVRAIEHGVTDDYIAAMKDLQFSPKTVDSLIRLRDHGVTTDYMRQLQRLGYHPSADEMVRLVDHGVTVAFIERMRSHGYTHLSADDLVRLRDHGF